MPNQLEELNKYSSLAINDIEPSQAKQFHVTHASISSKTILALASQSQFSSKLQKAIDDSRDYRWNSNYVKSVRRSLMLNIAKEFSARFSGPVAIELDADLAFDTEGLINQAREVHEQYRYRHANPAQLFIKFPATWEGIAAARELKRATINTELSAVYSFIQAQAAADAEASIISIPVGPASHWYQTYEPQDYSNSDPGVATLHHIHTNLKCLGYTTLIRGVEFTNIQQIQQLAGADQLEFTSSLAQQLQQEHRPLERQLNKAIEIYDRPPAVTEKEFRWNLTMNAMAHEKLAQDIRELDMNQYQLENVIKEKIESL